MHPFSLGSRNGNSVLNTNYIILWICLIQNSDQKFETLSWKGCVRMLFHTSRIFLRLSVICINSKVMVFENKSKKSKLGVLKLSCLDVQLVTGRRRCGWLACLEREFKSSLSFALAFTHSHYNSYSRPPPLSPTHAHTHSNKVMSISAVKDTIHSS